MDALNLPNWSMVDYTETDEHITMEVDYDTHITTCPACGTVGALNRFGRAAQTFIDLPVRGKHVGLNVQRQRYRCRECGKTTMQPLPDMDDKRQATRRLVEYVERESLKRTFVSIAEEVGLDEKTVRNIFRDYVARLEVETVFDTPEWLGIDELHLMKKPRAIFTNIKERTVIDLLETRTKAAVLARLMTLKNRTHVRFVTMDMWTPYREAVRGALPQARIIIDKFHVVRMGNDCLESIRKELRGKLTPSQRRGLMHDRFVLLRRKRDLKEKDKLVLDSWTKNYPQLATAYDLKESFFNIYDATNSVVAQELYKAWLKGVPADLLWAFQPIITAWDNWHREILNYFDHEVRLTNAYTEAANGLAKLTNRTGRGYSFEAIRAKIFYNTTLYKERRPAYRQARRATDGGPNLYSNPYRVGGPEIRDVEVTYGTATLGIEIATLVRLADEGGLD